MEYLTITDLDHNVIGRVSVLGTTHVAYMDAMTRASKLAAKTLGYDWAVAWRTAGEDFGTIGVSVSDGWNAGKTIARWHVTHGTSAADAHYFRLDCTTCNPEQFGMRDFGQTVDDILSHRVADAKHVDPWVRDHLIVGHIS